MEKKLIKQVTIGFKNDYVEVITDDDDMIFFSIYEYNRLLKDGSVQDAFTKYKFENDGIEKLYLLIGEV